MRASKIDYTIELGLEICEQIACSSDGIVELCKKHSHWPHPATVFKWLARYKDFSDCYARAKRYQIEVIVDEILSIADDKSNDYTINDDGKRVCDHEHINRSRLRIDSRKWLACKLVPKIYGDRALKEDNDNQQESSINDLA